MDWLEELKVGDAVSITNNKGDHRETYRIYSIAAEGFRVASTEFGADGNYTSGWNGTVFTLVPPTLEEVEALRVRELNWTLANTAWCDVATEQKERIAAILNESAGAAVAEGGSKTDD